MKAETNRNAFRRARTRTLASTRSAFFASCLVRIEAWRTVSPCLHPARLSERMRNFRQARYGIGFSIPYRGCVRPTSATYYLSNRQPAFSVLVSCSGLRHSRDEEPDVSRRPSSLRPDRRFSTGFIAPGRCVPACFEKAKYVSILASDTSVASSSFSRRPLRRSTSQTPRPRLRATATP
jgi:hypothetical protein